MRGCVLRRWGRRWRCGRGSDGKGVAVGDVLCFKFADGVCDTCPFFVRVFLWLHRVLCLIDVLVSVLGECVC